MNGAGNGNSMFRRQDSPYPRSPFSRPMPSPHVMTYNNPPRSTNYTYQFHGPSNPTFFIFQHPGSYTVNYNAEALRQSGAAQTERLNEGFLQGQGSNQRFVGVSPIPSEVKEVRDATSQTTPQAVNQTA